MRRLRPVVITAAGMLAILAGCGSRGADEAGDNAVPGAEAVNLGTLDDGLAVNVAEVNEAAAPAPERKPAETKAAEPRTAEPRPKPRVEPQPKPGVAPKTEAAPPADPHAGHDINEMSNVQP